MRGVLRIHAVTIADALQNPLIADVPSGSAGIRTLREPPAASWRESADEAGRPRAPAVGCAAILGHRGMMRTDRPEIGGDASAGPLDRQEPREPHWHVREYVDCIENGRDDFERYRMLISDLPRRFHQSSRERQESALRKPPRLTRTNWDALLAAAAEHIAITHDHPVPPWCDEPERFLDMVWVPLPGYGSLPIRTYIETPAAFLRHGVIIGGREFGEREGEREYGAVFRR